MLAQVRRVDDHDHGFAYIVCVFAYSRLLSLVVWPPRSHILVLPP